MKNPIAIGPMSSEIIEAVYRYSSNNTYPLMLIASKNQIDYNGGYVNNWTTTEYMKFINSMRNQYPEANVLICRDHCGPKFNGITDLEDTYSTLLSDVRNNFDLIHIDFCHYSNHKYSILEKSLEAIKYVQRLNPNIKFEIGTDEINQKANHGKILSELSFFIPHIKPLYFVVNTGSLVKEDYQAGSFDASNTIKAKEILNSFGVLLKEHNADYLTPSQIQDRIGIVDSINIAPQLGVAQTQEVISLCQKYEVSCTSFLRASYESKKWKKWLDITSPDDKSTCALFAGHYNFTSPSYSRIIDSLSKYVDVKEALINKAYSIIHTYCTNFSKDTPLF